MKRILCLALMLCALTGCSVEAAAQPQPEVTEPWEKADTFLSFATAKAKSDEELDRMAELVAEHSEGGIYCNIYASGRMGGDTELMQAVLSGSISVIELSTSSQTACIPALSLLDTPFLFADQKSCNEMLNGPLLDFFQPYYNEAGLQLLAWGSSSFRQLSSSIPVEQPRDLARLTIRVIDDPYHALFWSSVGAKTVSLPFSDLFYSIQQGAVNAQENPPGVVVNLNIQQLQPYLLLTNYLPHISAVVMNKGVYDSLAPEEQTAVAACFRDYCRMEREENNEQNRQAIYDQFEQVTVPGAALRARLEEGAQAVRRQLEADLGEDLTRQFYALIEAGA